MQTSIILCTRNEGPCVQKTMASLLASEHGQNLEILLLDDASTDGSCDFLTSPPYATDPRLRYVRSPVQKGYLAQRIEGVRLATGSVLMFLDAHHCFSPYWLTNLLVSLQRREFRALVGPAVSVLDPDSWRHTANAGYGWTATRNLDKVWPVPRDAVGPNGRVPMLAGHQLMVTREVYEDVGGFCPWFQGHGTEDLDFCLRAFLLGYDCHVEPSAMIGHLWKRQFMNPVSWQQVALNYFILVYLNLGEEKFQELLPTQEKHAGYTAGLTAFDKLRPELANFRSWMVSRQRRSTEELLAQLAPA